MLIRVVFVTSFQIIPVGLIEQYGVDLGPTCLSFLCDSMFTNKV